MPSLSGITSWLGSRAADVQNDYNRAKDTTHEALTTGNANANLTRRDFVKGTGLGLVGIGAGEMDVYSGTAGAAGDIAGDAWEAAGEAIPYELRSPITREDSNSGSNGNGETPEDTGQTSDEDPTDTSGTDFDYSSISEGLLEEDEGARRAFKGYTVTALDHQLDDVSYGDAIENTGEYESEIMEAIEGTEFEDGRLRVGEYGVSDDRPDGRWLDLDSVGFSEENRFDEYLENLEDEGELEDEVFGYLDDLERSDL